eukprot:COSAG01_NODE_37260_length_506_cov_0.459459_1_plen_54_part_01
MGATLVCSVGLSDVGASPALRTCRGLLGSPLEVIQDDMGPIIAPAGRSKIDALR